MTRTIHTNTLAKVDDEQVTMINMVQCNFASGTFYANSTAQSIVYDSNTYLGVGKIGAISEVEENTDVSAHQINLTLTGLDTTLMSESLNQNYRNRSAIIMVAFLDSSDAVVGEPVTIFSGIMDSVQVTVGETCTISLKVISRLQDWERTRFGRYTNEEQQELFAGDKGFEFLNQTIEKTIYWGRTPPE